jgi:predicted AAA+ superfamily ATPase
MKYKTRLLEQKLLKLGNFFPVVVLTGARQVGKSTLLKQLLPFSDNQATFDPVFDIGNARKEPELFLDQFKTPVLLDEIQYAPELLNVIKRRVDHNKTPGQYWLTGSQNLSMLKNISESLAGRTAVLSLFPMSIGEIYDQPTDWITRYLDNPDLFVTSKISRIKKLGSVYDVIWRGGYPGLLDIENDLFHDGLESYIRTYVERDIRLLAEISDLQEFERFVQLCANLTAQEINFSQLGREIGISYKTAQKWLNILISTFQWTQIPAFYGNAIKRLSEKPKGYFIDTAIACFLMRLSSPSSLPGNPQLGALFETLVAQDLIKQINGSKLKPALYHYRTHSGAEVDLIFQLDNQYFPIEIKCKSQPTKADTRGIVAFRKANPSLKVAPGLIIAPTEQVHALGENCFAVPYDSL